MKNINGIYNVSNGIPVALIDIIKFFEKKFNKKSNYILNNTISVLVGNNAKIKRKGFKFLKKNLFKI